MKAVTDSRLFHERSMAFFAVNDLCGKYLTHVDDAAAKESVSSVIELLSGLLRMQDESQEQLRTLMTPKELL